MLHFFKGCSWSKFNQAEPKSIAHSVVIHLMKQHKMIHSSNLPVYLEIVLDQQHVRLVSMYFISSCLASLKDSWMKGQKASILCIPSNKFEKSSIYSKKDNYVRTMLCCSRNNKILLEWRRVWMLLLLLTPNKILPMEISLGSW